MKKLLFLFATLFAFVLSSCSKMGDLSPEYFTTNPQVLETVGDKVPVTITGKFPTKYFKKNAVVEVTPVLRWNGGEQKGQTATFQGEKVMGNDQVIRYKAGGTYTMKTEFNYVPQMAKSELYLQFLVKRGSKTFRLKDVKIADGVVATSMLPVAESANPAYAADKYQRIIKQAQEASIMFLIQQAGLRPSELNSAGVKEFNQQVAKVAGDSKNYRLDNIEVSAYASPDGGVGLNTTLAANREKNTEKYVQQQLKKGKISTNVDTKYTAQDWEGFQELVSKSNLQDKDLILRVLSMYSDPEQRETEIKNISSVYKNLAEDILPQLRRARLTANYELIGRSDEEIKEALATNPSVLSVDEVLYGATLTDSDTEKANIFRQATQLYPNDARAYNNLGLLAYQAGDKAAAENYFRQALSREAASAEANTNMGLVELVKGNTASAETYLAKSAGANTANEALGLLYIRQGDYQKAVSAFGDSKSNGAALAQILTKDYNKAKNTLQDVKRADAYTHYLMAIVGARTNNASLVKSSMAQVARQNASLAASAQNDREFAKYANELR